MNPIAEEILSHYTGDNNELMHYGMPRRSGRYPWGSGEDPHQHGSRDFLGRVEEMRKSGFTYTDEKTGTIYTGDTAIAKSMGLSTTQFRTEIGLAKDERNLEKYAKIKSMSEDGLGPTEIGRKLGIRESTVRSIQKNDSYESNLKQAQATADFIKKQVDSKGIIDVGKGVPAEINVSKEMMDKALYILERDGYSVGNNRFEQPTNRGQWTTQKVIMPPGYEKKDMYRFDEIHPLNEDNYISRDGGVSFEKKFTYPASMDSKRLQIRYAEDGGIEKDGIVELRRGVDDLSLGNSHYSQVRILVDDTHFIKGMAVYTDDTKDWPDGVDVMFNTNKKKGTPVTDVLKKIKNDPDNPFGSAIKDVEQGGQYWYTDKKTGEKKLGLINKRADEGDWSEWKDALPSQFLAKQPIHMVKKQLKLARDDKEAEYDEICSITNPTIRKHYLEKFADSCDTAAVHLKAAALPGQKYRVIIPITAMKDNEVYAPTYENGTKLALVRYPHGGLFEIPILTVNNKQPLAKKLLGTDIEDAVGINSKVAAQLSGADFDGDTVMCIPTHGVKGGVKISSKPPLKDLEGFDSKSYQYDRHVPSDKSADGKDHYYDRNGREFRVMPKSSVQQEMGTISNLITDMTLGGADEHELARAVKHSMVVIDAEKHKLDYKKSEADNGIASLHLKYQGKKSGGAATIISKAGGQISVDKTQGSYKTNQKGKSWYDPNKPEGAKIYKPADDLYYVKPVKRDDNKHTVTYNTADGKKVTYNYKDPEASAKYRPVKKVDKTTGAVKYTNADGDIEYATTTRKVKSKKMAETDDAYTLVSDNRYSKEIVYADHANYMKALANKARLEMVATQDIEYSKTAKEVYRSEVDSLKEKVRQAELNAPRERAATRMAYAEVEAKKSAAKASGEKMTTSDIKKASDRAVKKYRQEYGAISRKDRNIDVTDREWEAIQAGAIGKSLLKRILNNADVDKLRERAMPKTTTTLSNAQIARIKSYKASGYTLEEIAKKMGKSPTTISNYLKGAN